MNRKDTEKKLHEAITSTFNRPKKGHIWVKSHFDIFHLPNHMISQEMLRAMTECVLSKRDQQGCPTHRRIHSSKRS